MTEEDNNVIDVECTSLATYDSNTGMELVAADKLVPAIRAQFDNRTALRTELLEEMEEGDHFGFPPGCIPEFSEDGKMVKSGYGGKWMSTKTYRPKKSLYQPGAAMICQIFGWTVEFHADFDIWKMAGSKEGSFYLRCDITKNGVKIGEGRGAAVITKQADRDINKTIKMAQKRAQVDATIRTAAIQDLFTQDLEDDNNNPAPKKDADSPNVKGRAERLPTDNTLSELQKLIAECFNSWKKKSGLKDWAKFVFQVTKWTKSDKGDLMNPDNWTEDICQVVMIRIDEMQEGGE